MSLNHYENFPVASLLCPPALRPAIAAIYAYARTADDLADEGPAPVPERLADLATYENDLHAVAAGKAPSPRWRSVFEALATTIHRDALPLPLLTDLLSAFRQDVLKQSYADRAELLDYCRRSANPIGRMLLHLYHIDDIDALRQSDAICSALQLANFWQDMSVDRRRGRLYVPLSECDRRGVAPASLLAGEDRPEARALVADMVAWARSMMLQGVPLVQRIGGRAGWELRFVVQGGLRILDRIEQSGCDALHQRPALSWADAPVLAWAVLTMRPSRRLIREEPA